MNKLFLLIALNTSSIFCFSQSDSIITTNNKIIIGTITLVNDNNIFYTDSKGNGENIQLVDVAYYSKSGKRKTVSAFSLKSQRDSIQTEHKIQDMNVKTHKIKGSLIVAGASIVAGSVLNLIVLNAKPPAQTKNQSLAQYGKTLDVFAANQKTKLQAAHICYGVAGVALIVGVAFNF